MTEIDTEFTYIPPSGADILTAVSVTELASLRATDAAARAAYARYRADWAFVSERLLSLPDWLAWLASDASTPPLGEEGEAHV
jgi:hypothetical protein